MLVIPIQRALELVDLLMGQTIGTSKTFGSLERSALAEVGNLTATFFMNSVAKISGIGLRPTPPAVMVDMVGAILDIIIATTGGISESCHDVEHQIHPGPARRRSRFLGYPGRKHSPAAFIQGFSVWRIC